MESVFTATEAAKLLNISKTAVGKLLRSGELEGKKNKKGHWEVTEVVLGAFQDLQEKTEEAKTDPVEDSEPFKFVMNDNIPGY